MPSNADRYRKAFVRQVEDAVRRANADGDRQPLDEVLRMLRRWVARPLQKGIDPRIDWSFWMDGELSNGAQARIKPLLTLLAAPGVPDDVLAELLDLTGRIAEMPHVRKGGGTSSLPGAGPRLVSPSYTAWSPELVLSLAHLPDVPEQVRTHGLMPFWRRARPEGTSETQVWSQALASWILADLPGTSPFVQQRRRRAFAAALDHGWLTEDVLDTWTAPRAVLEASSLRAMPRLVLMPADPALPGALVDHLALTETPGGLLEHWRASHPNDWSTRVSPASGTTVWAGLLHNPNPALLMSWLAEDPAALNRPVPIGRWHHVDFHDPKDPLAFRSVAGRTSSRGDLEMVRQHADPITFQRVDAWWNNPAPTLRQTLNVWWHDLLPLNDQPPQHQDAWHALVVQIERWDLERCTPTSQALAGTTDPVVRRARL